MQARRAPQRSEARFAARPQPKRYWLARALLLACLTVATGFAWAQDYPNRPVRIVVPFAAGGAVDVLARLIAAKLSESFGQPVIVENRPGAGGNTGADLVAKAPADGYTILQATNGQAISPTLYRSLPFDAVRDFIPVTQLVATSTVLVANPKLPVASLKDLIALAKSKPGALNYGSSGVGNALHLTMEMLKRATGIDIQAVPYRGDAPLNAALIAGEVDIAIVPVATARALIEGGQLRALAVTNATRVPALPDVPTMTEDALPGFEASGWQGFFLPARSPPEIVRLLARTTAAALASGDLGERVRAMGNEPVGGTPEQFEARFKADLAAFAKVIREAHIPLQD
jgi:tripartite-type tricarboxylate transporter receptor subunit TctC